jgi:phage-related protein
MHERIINLCAAKMPAQAGHERIDAFDRLCVALQCIERSPGMAIRRTKGCPRPRVLKGFGDASVLEVIELHASHAYRAMYTVRFAAALFVLHVFQKQSKSGIETPRPDTDFAHAFAIRTDYALTY